MNTFEKHPKLTLGITLLVLAVLCVFTIEWIAGHLFGLGKVVLYEAHPVYGYRLAPNQVVARKPDQRVIINNLGLRANENWTTAPSATPTPQQGNIATPQQGNIATPQQGNIATPQQGNIATPQQGNIATPQPRILFIGDSVTYGGSYIDNDDLFSEKIGKALPNYQTGNAAVNGWGVDNVVAFIKETPFLEADVYVLIFPEGDFYRGLSRIGGQPFWTRQPHFALEELWQYGIYKAHLTKTPGLHRYENDPVQRKVIANLAVSHLQELLTYLKAHDKKVFVYISPSMPQVIGQAEPDPVIKDLLAQYDIPAIYLLDRCSSLSPDQKNALFHDVIHLSQLGHEQWAQWMIAEIE